MSQRTQAAQVYFPRDKYEQIKLMASQSNQSIAGWIRQLALQELDRAQVKRTKLTELPAYKLSAPGSDTSSRVKELLYGGQD